MRTLAAAPRRLVRTLAVATVLAVALAGCAPGPAGDGPDAVVDEALARLAARDLDGLQALACAGQEDLVREQLGLSGSLGADLLPGLDVEALLEAVRFDVREVETGEPAVEGDTAQVPVTGALKVTFEAEAMRPILRQVLEGQGTTMTDEQLSALLTTLEAYGQDVPIEQSVRLVREGGAWRICQDTLEAPSGG